MMNAYPVNSVWSGSCSLFLHVTSWYVFVYIYLIQIRG